MTGVIHNGPPGTRWTNTSGTIQYQLVCEPRKTCGACLQYHMQVSPSMWPIPLHRECRCMNVPIYRGQAAPHEFVDFRKVLDGLSDSQKREAIGRSVYQLLRSGRITWEDAVGRYHVRTFREVVALKKLSIKEMEAAGVKARWAKEAHAAVHTPAADLARQQREAALERLRKAGIPQERLVQELARTIASRGAVTGGAVGRQTTAQFMKGLGHEEMLTRLLAGIVLKPPPKPPTGGPEGGAGTAAKPKKPKPPPAPPPQPAAPPQPPAPPASRPAGTPVGDALVNQVAGWPAAKDAVKDAIAAINKLHGDGKLPAMPIKQNTKMSGLGQCVFKGGPFVAVPDEIRINPKGTRLRLTAAHEIGHFLDYSGIPKTAAVDSLKWPKFDKRPILKEWAEAIKKTDSYKHLEGLLAKGTVQIPSTRGTPKDYRVDKKFVRYLLQDNELWARSYDQYVTMKSGNLDMLRELNQLRNDATSPYAAASQWQTADFEPVMRAIDAMFRTLGWIK